jgi:sacsin
MVPLPRRQNPQHQPLTVSLRKICRDYPAGAGILRELLQNADDAGASTVVGAPHQASLLIIYPDQI